jgi:hypothetical protein
MGYGSRKFLLAVAALLSADVFLALGSITPQVWAATVGSVLALYVAGQRGPEGRCREGAAVGDGKHVNLDRG